MSENNTGLRTEDGAADLKAMASAIHETVRNAGEFLDQMDRADRTRRAWWDGQQDDGRKPDRADVEPWPRASDVRIRLADMIVNDEVKVMKATSRRGSLQVNGTESSDYGNAGKTQLYLNHMRNTKLRREWIRQGALAANWRQTYGHSITAITWKRTFGLSYESLTVEDLQQALMQLSSGQATPESEAGRLAQFALMLPDPERRKEAAQWLRSNYPDMRDGGEWRAMKSLKETGECEVPVRNVQINRPMRRALKPFRDVFYPLNVTTEIQDSPWIAERCFFTPEQVDEKKLSEGWTEEFAEAVKDTAGKSSLDVVANRRSTSGRVSMTDTQEETKGLCEVFYVCYRHTTDAGTPCIYRTVLSLGLPAVRDEDSNEEFVAGPDGPLGYDHGFYPYIVHLCEDGESALIDSRGRPEIVVTQQAEIKWQRDARADQTDLGLRPPVIRPEKEVGLPLTIRPKGEIGSRKMETMSWMTPPAYQPGSEIMEKQIKLDADEYFARNQLENTNRGRLYVDDLIEDWAEEETECWQHVLWLSQQFTSDIDYTRVVGRASQPLKITRAEIQGQPDLQLRFSSAGLDNDLLVKRLEVFNKMLFPMVRAGEVDLSIMVQRAYAQLFPEMADEAIRPAGQGAEAEVEDEQKNWALIMSGEEPPMRQDGQAFDLRARWLENKLSQPATMARLDANPDSRELAMRRLEHLKFQVEQYGANAETGRVGVAPNAA